MYKGLKRNVQHLYVHIRTLHCCSEFCKKKFKSNSCKQLRKSLSILQGSALLSRLLLVRPRLGHARLGAHQELELAHDTIRCYDHHDQDHWSNEELISQRQKA